MYLKTEGIIINYKNFAEADRLLTIYTKDFGKIICLAKGVRRPKSRKSGHAQIGTWCKIFVAKGKNLDVLVEIETKKALGFENLLQLRVSETYHLLELIDHLTERNQKNKAVFFLLLSYMKKLQQERNFPLLFAVFKVKLLSLLGFFSSQNLQDQNLKKFFTKLEQQDLDSLQSKIQLKNESYLKLLVFLDSIIENLSQRKLKTTRFIYG